MPVQTAKLMPAIGIGFILITCVAGYMVEKQVYGPQVEKCARLARAFVYQVRLDISTQIKGVRNPGC